MNCEPPSALHLAANHVMSEMIFVVLSFVWSKEGFHVAPRRLDVISVIPGVRINERDGVIEVAVRLTVRPDILIRSPAIIDQLSAGFDPSTNFARRRFCPVQEQEMFYQTRVPHRQTPTGPLQGVPYCISADRTCFHRSQRSC